MFALTAADRLDKTTVLRMGGNWKMAGQCVSGVVSLIYINLFSL